MGLKYKRIYMNETITEEDKKLLELLNAHPLLRHRVEALMSIVEDRDETIEKADAAEQRVIEEIRKIGHAALSEWADCKNKRNEAELNKQPELRRAGKKTVVA
jgi:hypothetical protein